VFSALGFYPVCPGTTQYVLGTPLFKKMTINLEGGKKFIIEATNNSDENLYIQSALLNGSLYDKNWINHFDIQRGGKLHYVMSKVPNKARGTQTTSFPYSFSTDKLKIK